MSKKKDYDELLQKLSEVGQIQIRIKKEVDELKEIHKQELELKDQQISDLEAKLALTEKALELACEELWCMSVWQNTKEEVIQDYIKGFKEKAKIILLYTGKSLATGGVIKQSTLDKIMQDINAKGDEK